MKNLIEITKIILLSVIMLGVNYVSSHAQNQELKFKNLSDNDGLSQNTVFCIIQDSKGFMWFGTRAGGLNKYDGYSFTIYEYNVDDSLSISGNEIISLLEDSEGNIWAGTRNDGLNKFDPETETFQHYYHYDEDDNTLKNNTVNALFEDDSGSIWVGTNYGLCFYDQANDNFIRIEDSSLLNANIKVFYPSSKKGLIWLGCKEGLFLVNIEDHNILRHYKLNVQDASSIDDLDLTSVIEDSKGNVWLGTKNNGLYRLNDLDKALFTHYKNKPDDKTSLSSNKIRTIYEDKNGVIWIGTKFGLDQLNPEQQKRNAPVFIHNALAEKNDPRLNQNSIYSFYEDAQANFWIGTWNGGLRYLNIGKRKFKHYYSIDGKPTSLISNVVNAIEVNQNVAWIGTGLGLNKLNLETGEFSNFMAEENYPFKPANKGVKALHIDRDQNLWIGTYSGLEFYNKQKGKFEQFFKGEFIYSIEDDLGDEMWIGTGKNLYKLNKREKSYKSYHYAYGDNNSLSNNSINIIFKDQNEGIWIGTRKGLNYYNRATDNFIQYLHSKDDITSISHSHITSICEDINRNIWVGTFDGLNRFDTKNNIFIHYGEKEGVSLNIINNIIADEKGNLWFTTNKNITKFSPGTCTSNNHSFKTLQSLNVRHYDVEDGLQGNQFNSNASCKSKSGELFFGGYNGFNVFHPDSIKDNDLPPKVYITEFKLFNKPVAIAAPNSPLSKHITYTESISLNYKQSVLSFGFVALNYISPEKNQYAYIMEGFDKEWNYIGNKREATYTNLPAGEYVFRVKASNNDGVWNDEGYALQIKVKPPFWKTWWFRIVISSLIISLIVAFYSIRLLEERKINRILEEKVKERTYELMETNAALEERQKVVEEQAEELMSQRDELANTIAVKDKLFSVVAHDIKNPFGNILSFSELLAKGYYDFDDEKRVEIGANIFKSSQILFELLTSLLHWSRSQMGDIKPNYEKHDLIKIIKSNLELAAVPAQNKGIEIEHRTDCTEAILSIDKDLISTVIRNLISNALKFTPKGGKIIVTCLKKTDKVVVNIKDTGVGISKDVLSAIFDKGTHHSTYGTDNEKGTGLGLIICHDFVKLHKGYIWVDSEEGNGSEFSFSLPL